MIIDIKKYRWFEPFKIFGMGFGPALALIFNTNMRIIGYPLATLATVG